MRSLRHLLLLLTLGLAGCYECCEDDSHYAEPRLVSILVEVYDPATNQLWENVGVRVVQAAQEWSNCVCVSPFVQWHLTGSTGQVLIDEIQLAAAQVGFLEDGSGRAVLGPYDYEDQATVLLEVGAVGFPSVFVNVELHWGAPDVFVAVPFN